MNKVAVVCVRGHIGIFKKVKHTLQMLKLYRKNYCAVLDANPTNLGMINKCKDYVTWGIIDQETYKLLIEKKGEEFKGRTTDSKQKINYKNYVIINNKKFKPFFRLNPPRKGFGRKGIKIGFNQGGALGDRKDKINDLLQRMIQ